MTDSLELSEEYYTSDSDEDSFSDSDGNVGVIFQNGVEVNTSSTGSTSSEEDGCDISTLEKETMIVFLDVDSFDVQVRGKNAGICSETLKKSPFVVINDHNVITAVNYPAKSYGIKRMKECNLTMARQMCPNLTELTIPNHFGKPDALELKRASDDIYDALERTLQNLCEDRPLPNIEKASKDEFYIDVTDEVFHRVEYRGLEVSTHEMNALKQVKTIWEAPDKSAQGEELDSLAFGSWSTRTVVDKDNVMEGLMMHGAAIAYELVKGIREATNIVVSAGISSNKLLAKLGCGLNKPEGITIFPRSSLNRVSEIIKVEDIPGLGGELGKTLKNKLGVEKMSELRHKNLTHVMQRELAQKFHHKANGFDPSDVAKKKFCRSLTCGITFNYKTRTMGNKLDLEMNLTNRFLEMREHLIYECSRHGPMRIPKSLRLEIRTNKGGLKSAFGETVPLNTELRNVILSEATKYKKCKDFRPFLEVPSEWEDMHAYFYKRVKHECKLEVASKFDVVANAAIRKISEISLVATFNDLD